MNARITIPRSWAAAFYFLAAGTSPPLFAAALKEATVTQTYNEVKVVAQSRADRSANSGDRITGDLGLRTGQQSRAELEFQDKTLTRLGANTIFNFENGTRDLQLEQGTMLLQVPKGAGGAKIRTAAITAAITGTSILLEYTPDYNPPPGSKKKKRKGYVKVIVLEGTLRLYLNNRVGESVLLEAGQMLITSPDTLQLPQAVDIDIARLVESSILVNNRYWLQRRDIAGTRSTRALGEGGALSMPLIDDEIARQRALIARGTLVETNLGITGRGTLVMIKSDDILNQINTRTDVAQSQLVRVTPPVGAPINPGSFTIAASTTIATTPPVQSGATTAVGAVYRGTSSSGPFATFGFGTPRPFDAVAGFAGSFFGGANFPQAGVAVFRYGATLTLAGNVVFDVAGGRTSLALIADGGILTAAGPFTLSLTGLVELLLATGNAPLTIGPGATISGTSTRLDLYARGAASDLTVDGVLSLGSGSLFGAAERDIRLNGAITASSVGLVSGGSVFLNDRIVTGAVTANAGQDLTVQSGAFLQASGPITLSAARNLTIAGQLSAGTIGLTAGGLLTFGGGNLDLARLTNLTATGGSLRITSNADFGNTASVILNSANGIDASGLALSGSRLTINLIGGTLSAEAISLQTLTTSNALINAFLSADTVNVNGGIVSLTGGGASAGAFNVAAGATLDFAGGSQFLNAPASISGLGAVRFSGGTVMLGGTYNIGGLTTINGGDAIFNGSASATNVLLSSGTLGGTGNFHATGAFDWSGGTMAGPGSTTIDGLFTIAGAGGKSLTGGRTIVSNGVTNFSRGNLTFVVVPAAPTEIFTNNGTFNALDDADLVVSGTGTTPIFTNATGATFNKSGAGTTTTIDPAFTNAGTVNVAGGTLAFTGGYTQTAGTLALNGGNLSSTTALNLQGGLLTGAGTITGDILNNATIRPALAGSGLQVTGNLTLLGASQLSFQIGGLVQGNQYGFIGVGGRIDLNGTLVLSFANGFEISITNGNTFTLMTTTGFTGAFANVASGGRLSSSDGFGSFLVTYSGTTLTLSNFISGSANIATWLGGTGVWSSAVRWSSNPLVPNNGNGGFVYVAILNGGNLTQDIAGGVIIEQLQMGGGTLVLTNPLRLNAGLQFNGGAINGGVLNVAGASTQSALMTVSGLTLNNAGAYSLAFDASNVFSGGATFNNSDTLTKGMGPGALVFNNFLNNTGTVSVTSGTLSLTAGGTSSGLFSAATGATLNLASAFSFTSGAQFAGAGTIAIANNTGSSVAGTITNSGNVVLNSGGNFTDFALVGDTTLTGGGTLTLTLAARVLGSGILTNSNHTIRGSTNGSGSFGANQIGIVNGVGGLIDANVSGLSLTVDPNSSFGLVNQGVMRASNGGILLLTGNGGGGFDNTGGTISALNGSQVRLTNSASITGGTLSTVGTGAIHSIDTSFLTSLTNAGLFVVDNAASVTLAGTINNTGAIVLNSGGNFTDLAINGNVSLTGGGTVSLTLAARILGSGILTNVDNIIQGSTNGSGSFGANQIGIINQSLIDANVATLSLSIDPNPGNGLVNQGVMRASNGGILVLTGGGGGGFNNTGGTITALTGSQVSLTNSASITGGTLATVGTGSIHSVDVSFLTSLTNAGFFVVDNNASATVTGTINNTGAFLLNSVGNFTDLAINGNVSLTGGGSVTLTLAARILGSGILTNVDNIIQGSTNGSGSFGANQIGIVNQSLIDANVLTLSLAIDPNAGNGLVNQGLMRASNGGILVLTGYGGGGFDNSAGIITALAGSEVQLTNSAVITGGTLSTFGSGVIRNLDTASLTSLTLAGTFVANNNTTTFLAGTINNLGVINLASVGNLTDLQTSSVTLTGGGTVNLTLADRILGSGILTNVDNVIQGSTNASGSFGANQIGIVNQIGGLIDANVSGATLNIDPNAGNGLVNQGFMRASNGGILQLSGNGGGGFINSGGTILSDGISSSVQLVNGASVTGGIFRTINGGNFLITGTAAVDLISGTSGTIAVTGAGTLAAVNGINFNGLGGTTPGDGGALTLSAPALSFGAGAGELNGAMLNGGDANATDPTAGGNGGTLSVTAAIGDLQVSGNAIEASTGNNGAVATGGNGGTVSFTATSGTVTVGTRVQTSHDSAGRRSARGGNINVSSGRASGTAINIQSTSQLLALLNAAAPGPGGKITIVATGASSDIKIHGKAQADRGTVEVRHDGGSGTISTTSSTDLRGDIVKIGALGNNGVLTIGGGVINADSTIKLYATGSSGQVLFTGNTTLNSGNVAYVAGRIVTINNGVLVTVGGPNPAQVFTNTPNYTGFGGNGSTTGTWGGQGAVTNPFGGQPGF